MAKCLYPRAKVGVYVRVSTLDQEKGIASQEQALQTYADNHGLYVEWFRDRVSGGTTKRPGLDALEKAVFNGQVQTVLVWKLDRLTRRGPRDGLNLIGKWLDSGVRVVSITEQFDFEGPVGQMIASVLFSIAAMFREQLRENTKRGMQHAKSKGKKIGRPRVVSKQQVEKLKEQGLNMSQIAGRLGCSKRVLYRALNRD